MKCGYAYILLICLVLSRCTREGKEGAPSPSKNSIDSFFHEHFGEADELDSDSVKIKSLGVAVYSVHEMSSHGTDFRLISDDHTGGIFAVPIHRGHFIKFLPPDLILSSLSDSDEFVIANSMELGLEAFMNQASRLSKVPMSYDQLDSILAFHSNGSFLNRIRSNTELDSAYSIITTGSKRDDDQGRILDLLKARLQARQILLYNDHSNHLEAFIIEASRPLSKRDEGKYPLELNNVIHCQIGFARSR
jgi:hypothetical protein